MDCKNVQKELPSLIYGELDEETSNILKKHLDACPACQEEWERLEKTQSFLEQWPDVDAPLDPSTLFEGGVYQDARSTPKVRWFLKPLFIAAAACLLLVATLAFLGVEVRRTGDGVTIFFGRAAPPEAHLSSLKPGLRDWVRRELEGDMADLFEVMLVQFDAIYQEQEARQNLFSRALYLQREEDLRNIHELIRRIALNSAADSERNRLLLEGMAYIVQNTETEIPDKQY